MKITVTSEHIKLGRKGNSCSCPIALALNDAGFETAVVGTFSVSVFGDGAERNLPTEVVDFITAFDSGLDVGPLTFEIDVPEPSRPN